MPRNPNQLAIDALRKEVQRIAFDANCFDRGLVDTPHAEKCSKLKKKLLRKIEELSQTRMF